ncbi:MAG: transposase [Acidobacteriota bacterium]
MPHLVTWVQIRGRSHTLLAALGDTTRFPSAKHAASYLGLTPSTYQSGSKSYHGRITKQGSSHARFMMVEAAQTASRHPGPLGHFFHKLKKKKGRNPAIVALAHKLVVIAWHMLKNNEPYRYAMPSTLAAKFSRLRIQATGEKR